MKWRKKSMSFDEWIAYGINQSWCGPPVCYTHDGLPMTDAEGDGLYDGEEPCLHVVRMYWSQEHAEEVANDHSPTMWRNTYSE